MRRRWIPVRDRRDPTRGVPAITAASGARDLHATERERVWSFSVCRVPGRSPARNAHRPPGGLVGTRLLQIVAVSLLALLCVGQAADAHSPAGARGGSRKTQISRQFHGAQVAFHPTTGTVRMLGGSTAHPVATRAELGLPRTSVAAATAFLDRNAPLFGVAAASDLRLGQRQVASRGRTILRYQQTYEGVPVLAGDLVVDVSRGNDIISVNGEAANGLSLTVKPSVTAAQA